MLWLVAGAVTLALLLYSARIFANARVETIMAVLRWVAVVVGIGLAGFLLFTGKGSQALFAVLFFGPVAWNFYKRWQAQKTFSQGGRASPGQASRVETRTLRMELDHDSGTMSGTVLAGPYRGRELAELTLGEVMVLWRDSRADDPESVPLIEAWLDRAFPDWRQQAGSERAHTPPPAGGRMTRAEAFSVLGLADGASEADIRAAYLRLMRSAHPDRGGSAWLAARLNEARDVLLGS
jgi:DnaJ-domain-containing protein 1